MPPVGKKLTRKDLESTKHAPEGIRVYLFHGMDLSWHPKGEEAGGSCPFCGSETKFSANLESSKARCWSCDTRVNSVTFLRKLWELSLKYTDEYHYEELCKNSGFLFTSTPREWGVCRSAVTGEWLIPGYNHENKLTGLYRWARIKNKGEWTTKLLPTPGMGHHLFGLPLYEKQKPQVDLCEGWRDALAWYEVLKHSTRNGVSMLDDRNVLSVPGTNSFKPEWSKFFSGKQANIMFDNDHRRYNKVSEQKEETGGIKGVKRVASILRSSDSPPDKIMHLAWNKSKHQYDESLPDGMDLRDVLQGKE